MLPKPSLAALAVALLATPRGAFATHINRTLAVNLGSSLTFPQVVSNVINVLATVISILVTVLFLLGAFMMVLSRGKEDQLQKGKDLMIQSLLGLAVVGLAYAILRSLFYVLYVA